MIWEELAATGVGGSRPPLPPFHALRKGNERELLQTEISTSGKENKMKGSECLFTSEKLEGWDEIFVPPEEIRNLREMKRVWLIGFDSTEPVRLEIRCTYRRPEKFIEYMTAVSKRLISPDRGIFSIIGMVLNYDGSREPRQKKYDRKVIWSFLVIWAARKFPEKSIKEIYAALVAFSVNRGEGYYYLAPVGSMMNIMSTTGLAWHSFCAAIYWYTYPDELETNAHKLASVSIVGLRPEPIEFSSYDNFLKGIGLEGENN
jgi:hypothetical protein